MPPKTIGGKPTSDREGSEIQAVIVGILPRCFPESANGSLEIVFRKGSVRLEGGRIDLVEALLSAKDLALRDFGDGVVGDDGGNKEGRHSCRPATEVIRSETV